MRSTIQEIRDKIKPLLDDALAEWGVAVIVLLVGLASFGLGRLSAMEGVRPPVSVGFAEARAEPAALFMGALYIASRGGSVYYYPWCSGAQKIAPANQVWFSTEAAAKQAGYAPAKGCKGLVN